VGLSNEFDALHLRHLHEALLQQDLSSLCKASREAKTRGEKSETLLPRSKPQQVKLKSA
jgi:hypothetical protein